MSVSAYVFAECVAVVARTIQISSFFRFFVFVLSRVAVLTLNVRKM